jgi:hypothetical protein
MCARSKISVKATSKRNQHLKAVEVAAITGHKDLRMLGRYTHLRAEDLARKLAGGSDGE